MNDALQSRLCQGLPIFPLPRTVLMPGELLPLHVFEERYRALIRFCLDGDGYMGIATLVPGHHLSGDAVPPVFPEIGVGRIVQHQPLPDGRSNIILESLGRLQLTRELEQTEPFRIVQCEPMPMRDEDVRSQLQQLCVLVLQLGALSEDAGREAQRLVALSNEEMVDSLARKLLRDPDDRRAYLAAMGRSVRINMVQAGLSRFLRMPDEVPEA